MSRNKSVDTQQLIDELSLEPSGGKGWYTNINLECPDCGKSGGKFGIKLKDDGGLVNCWRCGYKNSIFNFLFVINKWDLVHGGKKYEFKEELDNVFARKPDIDPLPEEKLPRGFKRILSNDYLDGRGFKPWQYEQFKVGVTDSPLEPLWRGKVIFQIFNNGVRVGLLGRSTKDKRWHDQNMLDFKEGKCRLDLRYKNTDGDFNFMLGGLDDITLQTETVIIVEGLMDKANVDRLIDIKNQEFLRCVYCFGSSISLEQLTLLKQCKNVQKVIILFDNDAFKKVRQHVSDIQSMFSNVLVGVIKDENIDPGDMDAKLFLEILNDLKTPDEFNFGELAIKKLR